MNRFVQCGFVFQPGTCSKSSCLCINGETDARKVCGCSHAGYMHYSTATPCLCQIFVMGHEAKSCECGHLRVHHKVDATNGLDVHNAVPVSRISPPMARSKLVIQSGEQDEDYELDRVERQSPRISRSSSQQASPSQKKRTRRARKSYKLSSTDQSDKEHFKKKHTRRSSPIKESVVQFKDEYIPEPDPLEISDNSRVPAYFKFLDIPPTIKTVKEFRAYKNEIGDIANMTNFFRSRPMIERYTFDCAISKVGCLLEELECAPWMQWEIDAVWDGSMGRSEVLEKRQPVFMKRGPKKVQTEVSSSSSDMESYSESDAVNHVENVKVENVTLDVVEASNTVEVPTGESEDVVVESGIVNETTVEPSNHPVSIDMVSMSDVF